MLNINKQYKSFLNKVDISKEKSEEIYNNILIKGKKHKNNQKLLFICISIFFVIVGSLSIVYAKDIKNFVQGLTKAQFKNNKVGLTSDVRSKINYDADIPEATVKSVIDQENGNLNNSYSYEQLEQLLGIKLLKSEYFGDKSLYQFMTSKKDGKIAQAIFEINNFVKTESEFYNFSINLYTPYLEKENNEIVRSSGSQIEEHYVSSLDTTAYIFRPIPENVSGGFWYAYLLYDDVYYSFMFHFAHRDLNSMKEETFKILESLKY